MKIRDRYLTGILLILIGILMGSMFTLYQGGWWIDDRAKVNVTEVKRSNQPVFTDEQLEKMDDRFLFKTIAQNVTPTVVYIETIVPIGRDGIPEDELHNREDEFWDRILPRRARTVGSGVIISPDGYILTNAHVVEGAVKDGISVYLNDKRMFNGRVVGIDPTTDLSVLKIDAGGLPSIVIGNSDQVEVGEWVLAIGNPFSLRSTVTAGIVSALSRQVSVINDQMGVESFIQTDAAINKGNSGGALVNTSGELIGVNTAIASQSGSYQGYGFAVPSNLASKVARDIIEYGEVRRALLGVTIQSVDYNRARQLGMEAIRGVEIVDLSQDGAAYRHGIKINDVVLSVNGESVNELNELQEKIAIMHPGDIVDLVIWRNGKTFEKQVRLGQFRPSEQEISSRERNFDPGDRERPGFVPGDGVEFWTSDLGFRVMALPNDSTAEQYELIITDVEEYSEAGRRGLKEGHRIKKVGEKEVEDLETLKDLIRRRLESDESVVLHVENRDGISETFKLYKLN